MSASSGRNQHGRPKSRVRREMDAVTKVVLSTLLTFCRHECI